MIGLPEIGDEVEIWPSPDRRKIQDGPRPLDTMGGGRVLASEGRKVRWSSFHLEQLRAGDILLHRPPDPEVVKRIQAENTARAEAVQTQTALPPVRLAAPNAPGRIDTSDDDEDEE